MLRDTRPLLFAALLAGFLWLSWLVISPFLSGLVWAAVLVVTFRPVHDRLSRTLHGRRWAATTLVTLLVAVFVVTPLTLAAIRVVQGTIQVYGWVQDARDTDSGTFGVGDKLPWVETAVAKVTALTGMEEAEMRATALGAAKKAGAFVANKAPALVGGMLGLVFSFVVMLAMMGIFFSQGPRFVAAIAAALPVPRADADRILADLGVMTRSVFISVGVTALAQASLGTIAMLALGVARAFTLGAAMFFASLLPGGTALVWIPVAIWLLSGGHTAKAVILAAWCAGVVGTIDTVLRPLLARGGAKLSTAVLLIGMLGGLIAFGLVGVFVGPMILYVLMEILAVTRREVYGEAA
jgi:predicted PurR-regulated permease PerM